MCAMGWVGWGDGEMGTEWNGISSSFHYVRIDAGLKIFSSTTHHMQFCGLSGDRHKSQGGCLSLFFGGFSGSSFVLSK